MAGKVKTILLTGGQAQVLNSASGFGSYAPSSFKVGSAAGFTDLSAAEVAPRGDITFSGDALLMQSRQLATGTTRFTLVLPEGAGPFTVGNVVMYTRGLNGEVPFAMMVLPFPITKKVSAYDSGGLNLPNPGSSILINITLKQIVLNDGDNSDVTITVQVVSPEYANLPYEGRESDLPAPELIPWDQFILQETELTGGPAFVTKDGDNALWVMPFLKEIYHPKYNTLGGGVRGDDYREVDFPIITGHRYRTDNSRYRGQLGFGGYKDATVASEPVGFAPYKLEQ